MSSGAHLQEYDSELNFATDCWTSPNHHAFIAFTVHFEHQGEPIALLLDSVEVAASHTGMELANAFAEMLEAFGLQRKVGAPASQGFFGRAMLIFDLQINGVMIDNASNNQMMIEAMGEDDHLPHFDGHCARIRCFLHILSLVVKSLVSQFDSRADRAKAAKDKGEQELLALETDLAMCESMPRLPVNGEEEDGGDDDDDNDLVDAMEEMNDEECAEFEENVHPVKLVLVKASG